MVPAAPLQRAGACPSDCVAGFAAGASRPTWRSVSPNPELPCGLTRAGTAEAAGVDADKVESRFDMCIL
jgi:hypothetical protein